MPLLLMPFLLMPLLLTPLLLTPLLPSLPPMHPLLTPLPMPKHREDVNLIAILLHIQYVMGNMGIQ